MLSHNVFQNFPIFIRCFTIFITNWILALKSPSRSNRIPLCFFSSRSSFHNNSESLSGMYTFPIRVCFPFISTRFQMAIRLDCILLTDTFDIIFYQRLHQILVFYSVKVEWNFFFQFLNIYSLSLTLVSCGAITS